MRRFSIVVAVVVFHATSHANLPPRAQRSGTIDLTFPVSQNYQEYAAAGGNPRPTSGRLLMFLPQDFDAQRSWPVLIISSTSDGGRTSTMDAPWYRAPATNEGWIVLATDATIRPREDTTAWRLAVLSAALEVLHHDWPGSRQWPVVFAGMSGGAKRTEWLSAMLARTHSLNIRGLFLAGINDDRMPEVLQNYPMSAEFLRIPIWISSGSSDPIATPVKTRDVQGSLVHLGFKDVHLSEFHGGHELDRADLRRALKWFREKM